MKLKKIETKATIKIKEVVSQWDTQSWLVQVNEKSTLKRKGGQERIWFRFSNG